MKRHLQFIIVLLVLSSMILGACATPSAPTTAPPPPTAEGEEAVVATGQELVWSFPFSQRWDPARSSGFDFYAGNAIVFGTLTRADADGNIVPWLAESYEISDDGLEYTFSLRKDIKFNTGNPLNAHDFKFSWERAVEMGSLGTRFLVNVEGMQDFRDGEADEMSGLIVPDDYTLKVKMSAPFVSFLAHTAASSLGPVEEAQVAADTPEKRWMEDGGGGAGPYMIESFDPDELVMVAVRNPYYFGEPGNLDKITFVNVSDPQTRQLMFESGELDAVYANGLDLNALANPANPLSDELKKLDAGAYRPFPLRISMPPFDDPKFREAFRYAIDHEGIVSALFPYYTPWDSIAPPSSVWPGTTCGISQDVERAKQAFADSSYGGDPAQVPVIRFSSSPGSEVVRYLQAVQEQVEDVLGVKINLLIKDSISDEEAAEQHMGGWSAGMINPYPHYYINMLWWSEQMEYHSRWTTYQSDEVDALIEKAMNSPDLDEYFSLYDEVVDIICGEYAYIPGWIEQWHLLVKPYVKGLYDASFT